MTLVCSWRVLDISVAMAYALLTSLGKAKRSLSAAASMLRGFNLVCPLTDIEKKHLRLLVASRLACSVTLGAYSYQQNPGNEYLLLHAQPAWDALTLIWSRGKSGPMAEAIDDLFRAACMAKPLAATGNTIDCSDIAMPDPDVPDLLSSVRTQATTNAESIGDTSWIDRDGTMSHRTAAQKAEVLRHIGPGESWGMWQAIQEASPDILGSLSCDEIKNLARWLKDNDHYQPSKARWAEDQTQGRKYNEAQVRAYWAKQQAE